MRRIIRQPEVKAQNTALNNILLGIYYRHEFARRNEELIAASKTILGTLGIPLEQAEHFISPDGKTNMAKAIIDRVKAEPDGSRSQLMDQVASFFGEHRVLPMRCTSGTFFPKLKVSEFKLAFGIWGELMNLETFALARLRLGHPIMFPVMLINDVQLLDGTVNIGQHLKLHGCNYPVLTSLDTPKEVVSDYFTVLHMLERLEYVNRKEKLYEDEVFTRLPWSEAEAALVTYDFDRTELKKETKKSQVSDFYLKRLRDLTSKRETKWKEPTARAETAAYDRALQRGILWVKNYRCLIADFGGKLPGVPGISCH